MQAWEVTESADLIIKNSALAATVLNHPKQEPVHLLYSLTMIGNDATTTLKKHGLTLDTVRPAVLKLSITPFIGESRTAEFFSRGAVDVINHAIEIAQRKGHVASPSHLLMAIIKSNDTDAMEVLSALSVHPGELLRDATKEVERLYH